MHSIRYIGGLSLFQSNVAFDLNEARVERLNAEAAKHRCKYVRFCLF